MLNLKERALKRRIRKLDEQYLNHLTGMDENFDKTGVEILAERQNLLIEIEILDAEELIREAGRYGIDELPPHDVYEPKLKGLDSSHYFKPKQKAQLIKTISVAKYKRWKRWVELFVPILSLLIAALALMKDIIIAWIKRG
jgi:hypothetical protein